MDCNFTTIKTCELKDSAFRSRILDFGDFDISDYTFSVVYKTGFDQIISEQEPTAIGNILTVPLEAIEGASNRAKVEVWMFRDGGFKDKVIVFDVVISATGCPSDASITEGVSVTFGGLKVPVEVNQGIVNISREVAFSTLSPEEKIELKGEKGDQGETGDVGPQGPQGDPLTFSDLTTQQVNELKQPAIEAAAVATTAAQNADTAAGLATDATVEAVTATGQAIAATAQAENAAENANEAAEAANEAAANNMARYNDTADTLATDVVRRVDKATKENVNYRPTAIWYNSTPMDDSKVDGVVYIKRDGIYYVDVDFVINKTVRVSQYIPVDGEFHTIASIFPNVTLAEVQSFNPNATLNSSAAWYIISKLISWIPKYGVINLDCDIQIDHAIVFKRGFFKIISSNLWINEVRYDNPYLTRQPWITQISSNEDVITVVDGDNTLKDGYDVGEVWLKGFNLIGHDYTGDGIAWRQTTGVGQSGNFYMEDMVITDCKTGIKKYGGHLNNVFLTYVTSRRNYDLGLDFPSDSLYQTNYVVMNRCVFDENGLDTVNGEIVPYTQVEGAYNYDKGGVRISGTAIAIYDIALQINNGLGINIPLYMFGGFITGYAEQNQIGDIGTVLSDPDLFRNVQINLYSLDKRYYFPFDEVRAVVDFSFASQRIANFALKEYGRNFIENPLSPLERYGWGDVTKEINTDGIGEVVMGDGGVQIYYPKLKNYEIPKKGEYYHVSFDLYVYYIGNNRMTLSINDAPLLFFSNIPDLPLEEWTRVEHVFYLKADVSDDLVCFIKQGEGQGYRIKNISLRKLDVVEKDYFKNDIKVMPVQAESTATDVAGVVADLNALIDKLKDNNLMAPGV